MDRLWIPEERIGKHCLRGTVVGWMECVFVLLGSSRAES